MVSPIHVLGSDKLDHFKRTIYDWAQHHFSERYWSDHVNERQLNSLVFSGNQFTVGKKKSIQEKIWQVFGKEHGIHTCTVQVFPPQPPLW